MYQDGDSKIFIVLFIVAAKRPSVGWYRDVRFVRAGQREEWGGGWRESALICLSKAVNFFVSLQRFHGVNWDIKKKLLLLSILFLCSLPPLELWNSKAMEGGNTDAAKQYSSLAVKNVKERP